MSLLKDDKRAIDALEVMKAEQKRWEEACSQVSAELEAAKKKLSEYQEILGDAAEAYDAAAFEEAKAKISGTEFTIEMAEMRLERLKTKGFATKAEIDAAVKGYESQIAKINARACKEIFDQVSALIQTVDAADREAREALFKEKKLCELCGVKCESAYRSGAVGPIYASDIVYRYALKRLLQDKDLRRFASRA